MQTKEKKRKNYDMHDMGNSMGGLGTYMKLVLLIEFIANNISFK